MKQSLRPPQLLLAGLLLTSLPGCSKKEDPAPAGPATGTASYKYDGQLVSCTAKVGYILGTAAGTTYLLLDLTTTPQPTTGPKALHIWLIKPSSSPTSTYKVSDMVVEYVQGSTGVQLTPVADITDTGGGGYSGTFSGEISTSTPRHVVSDGVYTDVRL